MPGPVSDLCREDVGHEECNCQGARFLMLSVQTVVTRDTYKHEAYRTSLAPSRLTWPTGQAWYHRSAGRTNLELKVRPQDKPGTTKKTI